MNEKPLLGYIMDHLSGLWYLSVLPMLLLFFRFDTILVIVNQLTK